jgi:ATP phosphoribosyltransferase
MTLSLAIPSKGRLKDKCDETFSRAGLALEQVNARGYRAVFPALPAVEVMLLSAGEIAAALLAGDVHLGVTGEDLLREAAPEIEDRIALVKRLGFGFADVVVAVSNYWIDVSTMADLDDVCAAYAARHRRRLRVATKYANLTRGFFAHNGIADYRIVPSAGATEGTLAAGTAEAIVDITTTGATLRDNGLKVLDDGVILKSQANLAASLAAEWDEDARASCAALLAKLGADVSVLAAQLPTV